MRERTRLSSKGQVVIPKEIRRELNLNSRSHRLWRFSIGSLRLEH